MTGFTRPVVAWAAPDDPTRPLVVLLHGRGADETGIVGLAAHLPDGPSYAAVRAPIGEGGGYAWFANRGIGRPVAESLAETTAWFRAWLDEVAPDGRPVVLVGFSGGAAFAGGLLLAEPQRYAGAAILYGTLPFDAGVPVTPSRLAGVPVLVAQGDADAVIPRELLDRTWKYLLGGSHAVTTAHRDPGGHAVSTAAVAALRGWLDETLAPRPPAPTLAARLVSRAEVPTTPDRYAKQLVSHLGRKLAFTTDGATPTAALGSATVQVTAAEGALRTAVLGDDEADVARAEQVLGSHLERFGARHELTVTWQRAVPAPE